MVYIRVWTRQQTIENQERELRQWAERLGFDLIRIFAETASGARSDRAALTELLAAAHQREFDVLLVWALDRLTREGIGATARYLEQLRRHPGMHKTATVDYAIVLAGEIYAIMDEGETLMKAGDCLVQRGTNHAWSNRSHAACLVAFVLVSANPL